MHPLPSCPISSPFECAVSENVRASAKLSCAVCRRPGTTAYADGCGDLFWHLAHCGRYGAFAAADVVCGASALEAGITNQMFEVVGLALQDALKEQLERDFPIHSTAVAERVSEAVVGTARTDVACAARWPAADGVRDSGKAAAVIV